MKIKSKGFISNFIYVLFFPIWLCAISNDGDLDPTFGIDGKVTTHIFSNDHAVAAAVQSDGKIIIAGDGFTLVRYMPDGTLDSTFGIGGIVTTDFSHYGETATDLAIQADGKIVLSGYVNSLFETYFALVRYNSDGSLDTSFDEDGKLLIDFGNGMDAGYTVSVQSDGKIIAGGVAETEIALVRCNPNGSLDTSFSGDGKVKTNIGIYSYATSIVLQQNEKIIAAGSARIGANTDFALVRYMRDGSLDKTFGNDGKVTTDILGGFDRALDATIQPDKKILVVGYSSFGDALLFSMARYNADGSLDTSFDGDGTVTTDFGSSINEASSLALQPDGKFIVVGSTGSPSHFALARYNSDGSLDFSFGTDGKLITDFGGYFDGASAVVLQPDQKIIAAGFVRSDLNVTDIALARYIGTSFQFVDDFSDGDTTGWTQLKPKWTETNGSLVGTPKPKEAVILASPTFAGCEVCSLETTMRTNGGSFAKVWLFGWFVDRDNTIELLMNERTDRWVLKQKARGSVIAKAKGKRSIQNGQTYQINVVFDGSVFQVFIDDFVTPLFIMSPNAPVATGTLGFRVMNTNGIFDYVGVN